MGYDTNDAYDKEYNTMHPSSAYDTSLDTTHQSTMEHFIYGSSNDDDD